MKWDERALGLAPAAVTSSVSSVMSLSVALSPGTPVLMSERDELSVTLDTTLARNELGLATRASVPVNLFTV